MSQFVAELEGGDTVELLLRNPDKEYSNKDCRSDKQKVPTETILSEIYCSFNV